MSTGNKNSFAPRPPRGWNSWDCYGAAVTEEILKKNADYMAENLKEYGYEYIVCDIQWYEPTAKSHYYNNFADLCMDEYGRLIPAVNRFPSAEDDKGFAPIADYIHGKGLKFGIHIMRGIPRVAVHNNLPIKGTDLRARDIAHPASICAWNTDMYGIDATRPGAQEYVDSIIEMYASWGIDFIKIDDICVNYKVAGVESNLTYCKDEIELYRKAIDKTGREIVLSLSPGPAMLEEAEHLCQNANMWRITNDFWDDWRLLLNMFDRCEKWSSYVADGCYPDCDMIPVGHLAIVDGNDGRYTNFTRDEQVTMLSLWSIFRSPLILGCELTDLDSRTKELITNREVLDLNNNSRNARQFKRNDKCIIWRSNDESGAEYVAVFNISAMDDDFAVSNRDLELDGRYLMHDMWEHSDIGEMTDKTAFRINAHGCKLLRLEKMKL